MDLFWKSYNMINKYIPTSVREKARYLMEAHLDFLWRVISFSQFGEDIVLRDIVNERSIIKGFYVDIGAYAPKQFSNTYLLYKHGWRGINIDPTPHSMKVFEKVRKRDINLEVAISDEEKELNFYSWGVPTVTNTLSKAHADHWSSIIGRPPTVITLHTQRLDTILGKYSHQFSKIDVMNIDVEDYTMEVLRSNNWNKYRPTILIVEIEGSSIEEIIDSEENVFLLSKGYKMRAWIRISVIYILAFPIITS